MAAVADLTVENGVHLENSRSMSARSRSAPSPQYRRRYIHRSKDREVTDQARFDPDPEREIAQFIKTLREAYQHSIGGGRTMLCQV
jgi:hypothetical protein